MSYDETNEREVFNSQRGLGEGHVSYTSLAAIQRILDNRALRGGHVDFAAPRDNHAGICSMRLKQGTLNVFEVGAQHAMVLKIIEQKGIVAMWSIDFRVSHVVSVI